MLILKDILENNISKNVPFTCDCGYLMRYDKSSSRIECTNVFCNYTNGERMSEIFKILGMSAQIGPVKSRELMNYLNITNPIELFDPEIIIKHRSRLANDYNSLLEEISKIHENGIFCEDYIRCFFLDVVGDTRSRQLFTDFEKPTDFYNKYDDEVKMTSYISEKFGISDVTDTVYNAVKELTLYKPFILKYEKFFNFKQKRKSIEPINIVITGELQNIKDENGNRIRIKPRDRIKEYFYDRYNIVLNLDKRIAKRTDVLIMDESMEGHNKFNNATKYNEKGTEIRIMKSDHFQKIVEKMIDEEISLDEAFKYCKDMEISEEEKENELGGTLGWD